MLSTAVERKNTSTRYNRTISGLRLDVSLGWLCSRINVALSTRNASITRPLF